MCATVEQQDDLRKPSQSDKTWELTAEELHSFFGDSKVLRGMGKGVEFSVQFSPPFNSTSPVIPVLETLLRSVAKSHGAKLPDLEVRNTGVSFTTDDSNVAKAILREILDMLSLMRS